MYIVMNMNIYITKDNEGYLKSLNRSMSGLVNELLEAHRGTRSFSEPKIAQKPAPRTGEKIKTFDTKKQVDFAALKQTLGVNLCKHGASPELCKHAKLIGGKKVCT